MKRVLLTILALGLLIGLGAFLSFSAFTDTTENGVNTFETADVEISDNDSDEVMFDLVNLRPGDSAVRCIDVTNTGTVNLNTVNLSQAGGAGPNSDPDAILYYSLELKVEEALAGGSAGPAGDEVDFGSEASNFVSDDGSCIGADFTGSTELYGGGGSLAGMDTPVSSSDSVWEVNESHAYRFTITLPDTNNNALEGKDAVVTFTWTGSDA